MGDAPNIAGNLIAYIQGFSPRARDIFDKFEFEAEIAKLDEANRLFLIIKEFCSAEINLSPDDISNLQMSLPDKFDTEEYQVLLVAEKYQTGFVQPLLHSSFINKLRVIVKLT